MSDEPYIDPSDFEVEDEFRLVYGDDYIDITGRVMLYEKGKVFKCDCGQDIGIELNRAAVKCASCGRHNVDKEAEERSPPEKAKDQTGLGNFL